MLYLSYLVAAWPTSLAKAYYSTIGGSLTYYTLNIDTTGTLLLLKYTPSR